MRHLQLLWSALGGSPTAPLQLAQGGAIDPAVGPTAGPALGPALGPTDPAHLVVALVHGLEGVHALAWGNGAQQRALGAAGACEVVAALLAAPLTLEEASLAEKSLRAVQVLCRHGIGRETRDELNETVLASAGVCPGE